MLCHGDSVNGYMHDTLAVLSIEVSCGRNKTILWLRSAVVATKS